jgi:hypothetical protein
VPEFSVKFVDRSYVEPQVNSTSTDPFTGKPVTTSTGGYFVERKTVDIIIKNQNYPSFELANGTLCQLYLAVQTKGHFTVGTSNPAEGYCLKRVLASNSSETVVTLEISPYADAVPTYKDVYIPDGAMEDFQVNAVVGYYYQERSGHFFPAYYTEFQTVQESGLSDIQTLTYSAAEVSASPNLTDRPVFPTSTPHSPTPTPIPTVPSTPPGVTYDFQQPTNLILILAVAVLGVAVASLLVYVRRIKSRINQPMKQ